MADELINSIADISAIQKEADQIKAIVKTVTDLISQVRSMKDFAGLSDASKKLNDNMVQGKKAVEEYTAVEKELIKQQQALAAIEAKRYAVSSDVNKEIEKNKILLKQQNDVLKESITGTKSAAEAKKAEAVAAKLAAEAAKKLAAEEKEAAKAAALEAKEIEKNTGTLNKAINFNKQLEAEKRKLDLTTTDGVKRLKEINEQQDKNNKLINESKNADQKRIGGIGEYAKQLSFLKGPLATASQGFKMLGIAEGFALWPIALIVGALVGLYKVFAQTASGAKFMKEIFAEIGAVVDVLKQRVMVLIDGFKNMSLDKIKESFSGVGKQMSEAAKAAKELVDAQSDLNRALAFHISEEADEKNKMQELLFLSKDKTKSDIEKLGYMKEYMKLSREQADNEVKFAKDQFEIDAATAARKTAITGITQDQIKTFIAMGFEEQEQAKKTNKVYADFYDKIGGSGGIGKLEESYAKMIDADTEFFAKNKRTQSLMTGFLQDQEDERNNIIKESKEKKAETLKNQLEASRRYTDSELAIMADGEEKQIAISNEAFKRQLEDLKSNGQLTDELEKNLTTAHGNDIQKIKDDFAKQAEEKRKTDLDTAIADFEKNIQREVDATMLGYRQREADLKKEYANGTKTKEQYEEELLKIQDRAIKSSNEKTIFALQEELKIADISADKKLEISNKITDLQIQNENLVLDATIEANNKKVESDKSSFDKRVKIAEELAAAGMELFSAIGDLQKQESEERLAELDEQQEKSDEFFSSRQKNLDNALMSDGFRADQQKKIDEEKAKSDKEIADKVKAEKIKAAKAEKTQNIVSAGMSTALAVIKALVDPGGVLGAVYAILAGTTGAVQIAKIASAKIPEYATGTMSTKNEIALWGEVRPEVAMTRTGDIMFAEKPTLTKFDAGTRIFKSVEEFEKNILLKKEGDKFEIDYNKMGDSIASRMPGLNVNLDSRGLWGEVNKQGDRRTVINRRFQIGN